MTARLPIRRPFALLAALALAGGAALSVHVAMLAAGVAYPIAAPPAWAGAVVGLGGAAALLLVLRLARERTEQLGFATRWLLAFVILATIRETLRAPIMNVVVTGGAPLPLIGMAEPIVRLAATALFCTVAVRRVRSGWSLAGMAVIVALLAFGVQMAVRPAFAPVMRHFAHLGGEEVYTFPYPLWVFSLAYLTFAEAVFGAALVAWLIWHQLPGGRAARAGALAVIVAALKGVLVAGLLYPFFMEVGVARGALNFSQFLLEFVALGFLVGLVWDRLGTRPPRAD